MVGAGKTNDIGRLGRSGASVAPVARDTEVPGPTVRKCLGKPGLSERPPEVGRAVGSPSLGPCAAPVGSWLLEDKGAWSRQRHTARRVFDRLREE